MSSESYKAWIDAMPIDDVRRKIERLERKLADLHVLERLYGDRNGDGGAESAPEAEGDGDAESVPEAEGDGEAESAPEAQGDGESASEPEGEPVEGGGGWTQGEGSPEHG